MKTFANWPEGRWTREDLAEGELRYHRIDRILDWVNTEIRRRINSLPQHY